MRQSPTEQIRNSLMATRDEADAVLAEAQRQAASLSAMAAETDRAVADARLARLWRMRAEAASQRQDVESAYVGMAETMAAVATRLATAAREADFSPPPWPGGGIGHTVEVKLSETREIVVRFERPPPRWAGSPDSA
jgi:hypothetical protein